MVRYREEGEQIHYMVGRFPEISVAEARLRASEILSRRQEISDPSASTLPPSHPKDSLTLGEALETYVEAKKTLLRPRTVKDIRYTVTRYCAGYLDHPLATFDERTSGSRKPLPAPRPLRTGRASFPATRSSLS